MKAEREIIETRTEIIWLEDNIIYCDNKTVDDHGIDDAIENVAAANRLADQKKYLMLIDISKAKHVSIQARKYYISKNNSNVLGCAFVFKSPVSLIIGKMFLGINRPSFPVTLVKTRAAAVTWLKKL